jgi:hypothetical protein
MDANEHKYYYINSCLFVFIPCPPSLSLRRGGRGGFPYPWSPLRKSPESFGLAPPIRRIPDSCGKAGKPLFSFLFPLSYFWLKGFGH